MFISKGALEKMLEDERRLFNQELERQSKNFKKQLDDLERKINNNSFAETLQPVNLSSTTITLEELVSKVFNLCKEEIQQSVSNFDITSVGSKIYQDIDIDEVTEKIAEKLKDQTLNDLDKKAVAESLAQKIFDENSTDDLFDSQELSTTIAENIQITYTKPSSN